MTMVGIGMGVALLLVVALIFALMFYRRRNMQAAFAVLPASGIVSSPAWTPAPAPYNADYNNGFAPQMPPSPMPYPQDQYQQGAWNGNMFDAQPMQQAAFPQQQPLSVVGESNAQTAIDYRTMQSPEIASPVTPPVIPDESVSDPLLKAIMRQAQAGLFFLQGNDETELSS